MARGSEGRSSAQKLSKNSECDRNAAESGSANEGKRERLIVPNIKQTRNREMKNKLFPRKVQVMKAKKGKKTSFGKRWETAVCCSARIVYQLWACIGDLTWGAAFCS